VLFFGRIWEYKGLEYLIKAEPLITSRIHKPGSSSPVPAKTSSAIAA